MNAVPNVLDRFRLDGKTALVTGGARGLGLTMATALAQVGADIVIAGRSLAAGEEAATSITAATGRTAKAYAADVTNAADVDRLVDTIEAERPIDVLLNCAGVNIRGLSNELTEADWDTVIDTNLKGTFFVLPHGWPAHGEARLGPRHQHGIDVVGDRAARARAVLRVESGRVEPHEGAGARVGRDRRHGQHDLPRPVCDRDEPAAAQ